jgi:adenylate cyclase class IV
MSRTKDLVAEISAERSANEPIGVNVEIKARLSNLALTRSRVQMLAPSGHEELTQIDTFFSVAHGRFKLRKFGPTDGELIFYEREDRIGPKVSRYQRAPCKNPDGLAAVLGAALGVRGVVSKAREVFIVGQTRVHLDRVSGLGDFLELEVILVDGQPAEEGETIARNLLRTLGIPESALVANAYIDLLT